MRETTEKEDRVYKKLLLVGLLVVVVAMLSGCDLLDQIIDSITGGGTPGGGSTTSVYPISGRMNFNLDATVWRDDGYTGAHTYAGSVGTTFWSGAGNYKVGTHNFAAYTWDGGDFSNTWFSVTLSADEKTIILFSAMQTQANIWGGFTKMHSISGANVPFARVNANSRYYRIEGTAARALVTELGFKMWVPGADNGASEADPLEWITGGPAALTGNVDDYIEIRLDYQSTAVPPQ